MPLNAKQVSNPACILFFTPKPWSKPMTKDEFIHALALLAIPEFGTSRMFGVEWATVKPAQDFKTEALKLLDEYESNQWQPIETAPKDGLLFLAWDSSSNPINKHPNICIWDPRTNNIRTVWPEWRDEKHYQAPIYTHWAQLPQPPANESEVTND